MKIGSNEINLNRQDIQGSYIDLDGDRYYRITGYDRMETFFMTVVSNTDQWMFLASNGGITAGRHNPELALFPYYTDDKIVDSAELTGSKTLIKVGKGQEQRLWEPFSNRYFGIYRTERNIYKNKVGNKVRFEEMNLDLGLSFSYEWTFSPKFGFVKKAELKNLSGSNTEIEILDGLRNLLPWGINSQIQNARSTLADAYKKNELIKETGLGIFSLSSMIVDRAEPSEALKATIAWSSGLEPTRYLLSTSQLNSFRKNESLREEKLVKATKAAYFINSEFELAKQSAKRWIIVAEVGNSTSKVIDHNNWLLIKSNHLDDVQKDIEKGTKALRNLVGLADGIQAGQDELCNARHFSNVLFNIMRGGVFESQYKIDVDDLKEHVALLNKPLFETQKEFFNSIPNEITYQELKELAEDNEDPDLQRLIVEYLPLSFSRRHGDPSRPWNNFSINIEGNEGERVLDYEGNWRDIFQNWEALSYSFPAYIEGMISKFLNASTRDGYNPYRITREGIDWEIIEPDNPWSYIGYWGDHQIIYLQKLFEHANGHYPELLRSLLNKEIFTFSNVPYRIKGFEEIKMDPFETIDFDQELHDRIMALSSEIGSDAKLILDQENIPIKANLTEKILVMLLAKLYNFVPDGGIWLNTQRPEWNDANNALVGNGLSLVTLNYLRRFIVFALELFDPNSNTKYAVSDHLIDLFNSLKTEFQKAQDLKGNWNPSQRASFVQANGKAGEKYRRSIYRSNKSIKEDIPSKEIYDFLKTCLVLIEETLNGSKRKDGLFHSYNLIQWDNEGIHIGNLYEMLEGQVAALSSGLLSPKDSQQLLDKLKDSKMFRDDQYSYLLYPNRELPGFTVKNLLPADFREESKLARELILKNDKSLFEQDTNGNLHFSGQIHNSSDLTEILDQLESAGYKDLVNSERSMVMEAFEKVFNHKSFTGRSGTFYGYEGLGSIYWHMVSKLLLAVQENIISANNTGADEDLIGSLVEHYFEIRAGIGFNKSPGLYGAFPTDAYSHTPENEGAQQPGMTGQVKEDILNRWAELGISVVNGRIEFNPTFLNPFEYLDEDMAMNYVDVNSVESSIQLEKGQFGFTYCGVPVRYIRSGNASISISFSDGSSKSIQDRVLPEDISRKVFNRTGEISAIQVELD